MTWYTFFLSLHVIASIVWVGGIVMLQLFAHFALASPEPMRRADYAEDAERIGLRLFMPSSLVVLLTAVGMMENGDLRWGMNWTVFGLAVFAASFLVGVGFFARESGRLANAVDADAAAPEVGARLRRIVTVARVQLVFLVAVVWAMAVQPSGKAGWFWGGVAVAAVVAVAILGLHAGRGGYTREQSARSG